jgi:prevent-host-death family protein
MKTVSVAELKARLSMFLAAVKRGEEVIITDRGKPVARLSGLEGAAGTDSRVAELVHGGLMRPPVEAAAARFLRAQAPCRPGWQCAGRAAARTGRRLVRFRSRPARAP